MANKKGEPEVYIARESGACEIDGESFIFVRGKTRVRAGHALLRVNPQYFEPVENDVHYEVEAATAAPGEKRGAA